MSLTVALGKVEATRSGHGASPLRKVDATRSDNDTVLVKRLAALFSVRPLWARRRLLYLVATPSRGKGLKPPKPHRARSPGQRTLLLATSKSQTRNQRFSFLKLEISTRKSKPEVKGRSKAEHRHTLLYRGPGVYLAPFTPGTWNFCWHPPGRSVACGCHRRILGSARSQPPGDQHTKCRRDNLVILTDALPVSPGRSVTHGVSPTHPRFRPASPNCQGIHTRGADATTWQPWPRPLGTPVPFRMTPVPSPGGSQTIYHPAVSNRGVTLSVTTGVKLCTPNSTSVNLQLAIFELPGTQTRRLNPVQTPGEVSATRSDTGSAPGAGRPHTTQPEDTTRDLREWGSEAKPIDIFRLAELFLREPETRQPRAG